MRYSTSFLFITVLVICILGNCPARAFQYSAGVFDPQARTSRILGVQLLGDRRGVIRTAETIYITDDSGSNWRELPVPVYAGETISGAFFLDENTGSVVLADIRNARLSIAKTVDGGISWSREQIGLRPESLREALPDDIELTFSDGQNVRLTLRLASSSNFTRKAVYETADGGITWGLKFSDLTKNSENVEAAAVKKNKALSAKLGFPADEQIIKIAAGPTSQWLVTQTGHCVYFKTACTQTDRLYRYSQGSGLVEVTPAELREASRAESRPAETLNPILGLVLCLAVATRARQRLVEPPADQTMAGATQRNLGRDHFQHRREHC